MSDITPTETIQTEVKAYILQEFLPGENPDELTPTTPLFTSGVLDSISTIKLVSFLEQQYDVAFQAHEMNANYLDTLDDIAETIQSKQG